jgi:hypothetical protein
VVAGEAFVVAGAAAASRLSKRGRLDHPPALAAPGTPTGLRDLTAGGAQIVFPGVDGVGLRAADAFEVARQRPGAPHILHAGGVTRISGNRPVVLIWRLRPLTSLALS